MTFLLIHLLQLLAHLPGNGLLTDSPQIVRPSDAGEEVDEQLCQVEHRRHLRSSIVLRERVMVIVTTFAKCRHSRPNRLRWCNADVIWTVAKCVRSRVDEPGGVQREAVAEQRSRVESNQRILSPQEHWNSGRQHEAEEDNQRQVVFSLEGEHWIGGEIGQVKLRAHFLDLRVLLGQQPAHVREEETAVDVVRIGICVSPLVMASVIATPLNDIILEGDTVHRNEDDLQRRLRFIALVRPKTMRTGGDSHSTNDPTEHTPNRSQPVCHK